MASDNFVKWTSPEGLIKIRGMRRDGMTLKDVGMAIGIGPATLRKWRNDCAELDAALREGKEIVDYKVEDALIRAALGYQTKTVTVTEIFRYGKLAERQKMVETSEVAPNVTAIQTYLYNRMPDKWKKNRDEITDIDDMDGGIQITVTRAGGTSANNRESADILPEPGSAEDKARTNEQVEVEFGPDLRSMERQQEEILYGPDEDDGWEVPED